MFTPVLSVSDKSQAQGLKRALFQAGVEVPQGSEQFGGQVTFPFDPADGPKVWQAIQIARSWSVEVNVFWGREV
jgi:hypothetical protein